MTEPRIVARPEVGVSAGIIQQQDLEFRQLHVEQPLLIVVERGIKSLRWSGGEYLIRAGEAIAVAGGQSIDITNRLVDGESYRACWLAWDHTLIAAHADRYPGHAVIRNALPIVPPPMEFDSAFRRALQGVEDHDIPLDIARHRASELLLWIGMHGGRFEQIGVLTQSTRLRRLIAQDVARDWNASTVSSAFAMSEATLRRKLAEEGTTLSEILVEARMSFALRLLQSSTLSVTQIALNVGYQTPSHFAVRFRRRFGFAPTAIRNRSR